jgi:hypothetical protein
MKDKADILEQLPECSQKCIMLNKSCDKTNCDHWINFDSENNCDLVSILINGPMSLRQIGERIGVSYVRVKQIEEAAIQKIKEQSLQPS